MNCDELCERYNLTKETIEELEKQGFLTSMSCHNGEVSFSEEDLGCLNRIFTLKNAGIDLEKIKEILKMEQDGSRSITRRLRVLKEQRDRQMRELHRAQKTIDRLDFLIHELRSSEESTGRENDKILKSKDSR